MPIWTQLTELLTLPIVAIRTRVFEAIEQGHVARNHYRNAAFRRVDRALLARYRFRNPYRISRRFLESQGVGDVHTYGETPLSTIERLARQCGLNHGDVVYELGCGRGRTAFWLRVCVGCSVVGVELVPSFVKLAGDVRGETGLDRIEFRNEDFLETDLDDGTFIYLSGTCLPDEIIERLTCRLATLKPGTRILTISYPLSEYGTAASFRLVSRFPARFAWGETTAFLQEVDPLPAHVHPECP